MIAPRKSRPAHGGYPTPDYNEVPARRRAESQKRFGHAGAWVLAAVRKALDHAARTEKMR